MIDIHSHILPNIDDGARDINETFDIINEAISAGFTDIFLTPHYMSGAYTTDKTEIETKINVLKKELSDSNININLHCGAENYICQDLDCLIRDNVVPTLNNSRYILFELPMNSKVIYLDNIIYKLISMNLVPIIAHPERYTYVQDNPNMLIDLIQKGVLFQSNFGSIIGEYGRAPQKTIKKLLKNNMVHFLASDTHRHKMIYTKMDDVLKELKKLVDDETIELLTQENPRDIVNNKEIDIYNPIKIKKFFS